MTAKNRSTIKSVFEQGDKPQGSDYADLVDSYVSIADSTAQALSSPLTVTGALGASTTVSAVDVEASAASFTTVTVSGAVSANTVDTEFLIVKTTARVSGNMSITGDLTVGGTFELVQGDVGEIYITATAGVSASASYTEVITVATAQSQFLVNFSVSAGSLVYNGATTRNFLATGRVNLAASGAGTETILALAVDGSALSRTETARSIGTTTDAIQLQGMVRLAQNERVSIMIKGSAATADGWQIKDLDLVVKQ